MKQTEIVQTIVIILEETAQLGTLKAFLEDIEI